VPLGSDPGPAYRALLAWPADPVPWPLLEAPLGANAALGASALLVLGAVVALVRRGWLRVVRAGWILMLVGLAASIAASRTEVGVGWGESGLTGAAREVVRAWAGAGTSVVLLGTLVAIMGAADGLIGRLASSSFGWRQVGAAALTVLLVLAPVTNGIAWVWQVLDARRSGETGAVLALQGRGDGPVPALGGELQRASQDARVLALDPREDELVIRLWRADGDQLDERLTAVSVRLLTGPPGSAALVDPDEADADLAEIVASLALGASADAGERLAEHAVGVVVVPPGHGDARDGLVSRLDGTAGLERVTENSTGTVWRVAPRDEGPVARATVVSAEGVPLDSLASAGVVARGPIGAGEPGRLLVLAERADPGWRAWLDGRPLPARSAGWRQAFALPPAGGELTVTYLSWALTLVHSVQAVVLGAFGVLALPLRRRRAGVG
jgi:hypothetical protein